MRVYNGDIIAMWYYQCINTIYLYKCVFYGDSNYSTCLGYIYIYIYYSDVSFTIYSYIYIYILSMKLNKQGNVLSSLNYIYIIVP